MKKTGTFLKKASGILKVLFISLGVFFILSCMLAFTTLPYYAWYWLGTHKGNNRITPAAIVLLGGSGMPSGDGLIRSYFTAALAKRYPDAILLIALPGDTCDSLSSPCQLKQELVQRSVEASRIIFESAGRNTRQQALSIFDKKMADPGKPITLVTSPEHMYRAILSFEKVGFLQVQGYPTFETSVEEDQIYFNDRELKGNTAVPPIGHNKQLRYQFWNHLKYEILVLREYFALGYYKIRAWI
jgi:uncharacterized SAM-binding protein YcdF (DUF218 family)